MLTEAGAFAPLSIVTLAYIEFPPTVVVGDTRFTEVLEPVTNTPVPACSMCTWTRDTWVGLFSAPSAPYAQELPLHTMMSALGSSVAVAPVLLLLAAGQLPEPVILNEPAVPVVMVLIGQVLFHGLFAGLIPAMVT